MMRDELVGLAWFWSGILAVGGIMYLMWRFSR